MHGALGQGWDDRNPAPDSQEPRSKGKGEVTHFPEDHDAKQEKKNAEEITLKEGKSTRTKAFSETTHLAMHIFAHLPLRFLSVLKRYFFFPNKILLGAQCSTKTKRTKMRLRKKITADFL